MRRARPIAAALALVLACALPAPALAATGLARATAAVVAVTVRGEIVGSGVIVADGYVLTAAHVADDVASYAPRVLRGGAEVPYTLVAIDRTRDLALLKLDTGGIQPVEFAYAGSLSQGEDVIALGFPIGLKSVSFTKGVVSSPAQDLGGQTFIQTDAAINPGNSGGALVDSAGDLVGINVQKVSGGGVDAVGFSVPESDALDFVRRSAPSAALEVAPSPARSAIVWTLAISAAGVLGLTAAFLIVRRRTADLRDDLGGRLPAADGSKRRTFHVAGPSRDEEITVRLPAVVGSARNADIRIQDAGVRDYHARIGLEVLGTVAVTDLADGEGVYCGDLCVLHAVIEPGMSFRVGATEVTLVERRA